MLLGKALLSIPSSELYLLVFVTLVFMFNPIALLGKANFRRKHDGF